MSLLPRTKASVVADGKSSTELGRLFIVATADGKYQYGVDRGAAKPIMANGKFELGTTQLIVVKYAIATDETPYDIAALYVNPTSFDKEPTTPDATTDANTTGQNLVPMVCKALNYVRVLMPHTKMQPTWWVCYALPTPMRACLASKVVAVALKTLPHKLPTMPVI